MMLRKLYIALFALLAVQAAAAAQAQSIGVANGLQIRLDAGKATSNVQLYIRQRGLGWSNISENIQFNTIAASTPVGLIDIPMPSITGQLPDDFRLAITNTDQIQTVITNTTSLITAATLTTTPTFGSMR